jgi:hypothetical protein
MKGVQCLVAFAAAGVLCSFVSCAYVDALRVAELARLYHACLGLTYCCCCTLLLLQREIEHTIANADAAQFLQALLCKDPAQRPEPQAALQGFAWLQPAVNPALQLLQQQVLEWPQQRQAALRAAQWMELVQLQKEVKVHHGATQQVEQSEGSAGGFATAATGQDNQIESWGAAEDNQIESWGAAEDRQIESWGAAEDNQTSTLRVEGEREVTEVAAAPAAAAVVAESGRSKLDAWGNEASSTATPRMSSIGMPKGGPGGAVHAERAARRELAPLGAEQHDGW